MNSNEPMGTGSGGFDVMVNDVNAEVTVILSGNATGFSGSTTGLIPETTKLAMPPPG